jgi:hypothetical protein
LGLAGDEEETAGWVFLLCFQDGLLIAEIETNVLIELLIAEEGIWSLGVLFFFLVWQIGVFAEKWSERLGGYGRETQPWVTVVCWRRGMLSGAVGCC